MRDEEHAEKQTRKRGNKLTATRLFLYYKKLHVKYLQNISYLDFLQEPDEVPRKSEIPQIKCKGTCNRKFPLNGFRAHLSQSPSCSSMYSKSDFMELDNQCNAYQKEQKKKANQENYQKRKVIVIQHFKI